MRQLHTWSLKKFATVFAAVAIIAVAFLLHDTAGAQQTGRKCDPHKDKTLYIIGYAHLDTQWRWTYKDSIYTFIPNTMHFNFNLFEKYPGYHFNFTGARRYMMMKEYYPADYARVKDYIAQGRWYISGSSVDEDDANVPSPESIVRHVLYGNRFFNKEFGRTSIDYMLPDCFGFTASLPSVLAHAGLKGFSTQKLSWNSAVGIPFNVGVWEGPDGRYVVAALNPGSYGSQIRADLSKDMHWLNRIEELGKKTGFYGDFKYYGTGDIGGSPDEESVKWLQKSLESDGPVCVYPSSSDQIFRDVTDADIAKMDRYKGDLLLVEHSAGSLSSQAYMKRWNRKNELLADDAERASVVADWLGAIPYQRERITNSWYLILGSQMHDILPGTSVPKAYEFSWNDEVIALNNSAGVLEAAVGAAARELDTRVTGEPVVVFNPLSSAREDIVQAKVRFNGSAPANVRVFNPQNEEVPSQIVSKDGNELEIIFLAEVPSVGYAVYDVRKSEKPCAIKTGLKVTANELENDLFRVKIDGNGDVSSIMDKTDGREVLSAPARLAMLEDSPRDYPAWNIDWDDRQQQPRAFVQGPPEIRVTENGPARIAIEITREAEDSRFSQTIRLTAGSAGNRVVFDNSIDWRTPGACLKAAFPLSVANEKASYNLELGVVERVNNHPRKYEVPSHQWFDLTAADGSYGASILEDSKFASDKPDDNTIRLTLLRTPACTGYCDQATQDFGHHQITYAIAPHEGDWRRGDSHWQAFRLNQPALVFNALKHKGSLGKSFSFLKTNTNQVAVRAIKKAEEGDEIIIRVQELHGRPANGVKISFAAPIVSAREVNGQEQEIGAAQVKNGELVVDMTPFILRAFAVRIGKPAKPVPQPLSSPITLVYDTDAASLDSEKFTAGFDGNGNSYPGEMLPSELSVDGITFKLGPTGPGQNNTLACRGQKLTLPKGNFNRLYILAAAAGADVKGNFKIDNNPVALNIQDWTGYVGQWDNRIWKNDKEILGLKPAFTKRAEIAWFASHHHNADGKNQAYNYSYLFKYRIDLPDKAAVVTLPDDERIRIFAATAAWNENDEVAPAQLLYDDFERSEDAPSFSPAGGRHNDSIFVSILPPWYSNYDEIRYTTDGSDPTPNSALYSTPLLVTGKTAIRARAFGRDGRSGLIGASEYDVNDVTPPRIESVIAFGLAPSVIVGFSEPVDKTSAERAENFSIAPAIKVESAELAADKITLTLNLSSIPIVGQKYTLTAHGLRDLSAAANAISAPVSQEFSTVRPALDVKFRSKDVAMSLGVPGVSRDFRLNGNPKTAKGIFGLALRLSGEGDCIIFSDRPELNPTKAITLAAWIKPEDWNGNHRIMQKGNDDNQYRLLKENDKFVFHLANVGTLTGPLPPSGKWSHVAATYDGQLMRLYIDGATVAEQSAYGEIPASGDPLHIGAKSTNSVSGDYFKGDLDKIMIWGYALPPDQIKMLANPKPAGLKD
ncbi:MAG: glycoside hydrolase family 38 C-terminal domain-containing protein [bacterium]